MSWKPQNSLNEFLNDIMGSETRSNTRTSVEPATTATVATTAAEPVAAFAAPATKPTFKKNVYPKSSFVLPSKPSYGKRSRKSNQKRKTRKTAGLK